MPTTATPLNSSAGSTPPHGPEREAACAELRALRPKVLEAMDELMVLQIKHALQLRDTPTDRMSRA